MKKTLFLLAAVILAVSCGGTDQNKPPDENSNPTSTNDCSKFVPAGFTLERQLEGCDFAMGTARKGEGICPRVLIVVKDGKLVGLTKELKCKSIDFGKDELICAKISDDIRGVPVEFDMGGGSLDDVFIKIIDDKTFRDVPVKFGAGLVPKDFNDVNSDGKYELVVMDNRWFGLKIFEKKIIPFTYKVGVFDGKVFNDETVKFKSYLDAGIKAWVENMSKATTPIDAANAAVIAALIYRDEGLPNEGLKLIDKILAKSESKDLNDSLFYFISEYKKNTDPDWFYPARKPAWMPLSWQQTNSP